MHEIQRAVDRGRGADRSRSHGQALRRRPRERQAGYAGARQGSVRRHVPGIRRFGKRRGMPELIYQLIVYLDLQKL